MSITIPSSHTIGSELSVRCDAATVQGISSHVEILWTKNNTTVEKSNNRTRITRTVSNGNVFTNFLNLKYLSEDDRSGYTCSVMLLDINISESVELNNIISKFILHLTMYLEKKDLLHKKRFISWDLLTEYLSILTKTLTSIYQLKFAKHSNFLIHTTIWCIRH